MTILFSERMQTILLERHPAGGMLPFQALLLRELGRPCGRPGPRPVRSRHTGSKGTERMSLQFLCIRAIAQNLKLYKNQPEDFWYIPFYHKERILCEVSGLQDNQLHLFEDEQLQSLSLHRSTVKVSTLADFFGISLVEEEDAFVTFEQSSKLLVDEEEPLDSWEQYESSEIDNPPPIIPCNGFNISSLDISFSVLLSGIATAKLISLALPRLQRLSIAGCFDFAEGPSTLGILSRNLLRLEDLDISHCNWATAQALSYVGWDSRWFTVMVLRAVNCDRTVEQFKFDVKSQRPGLKVII
ncbi:hypothetical protein DFS34DRAFT_45198 [Phlyctochytrium arcticum]|nr:hypothetical protein DFS34DRAFT_45198 [Phlyctochytrium arcticum]